MTPPDLLALAARVEAAGGADRELDAEIIAAIGKRKYPGDWWIGHQYIGRVYPLYTASLDAAMTLVPRGCLMSIRTLWEDSVAWGYAYANGSDVLITSDDCKREADAILALLQPGPSNEEVPEGYALVPREPTEAMIEAWADAHPEGYSNTAGMSDAEANRLWASADWSAMLAAAPAIRGEG